MRQKTRAAKIDKNIPYAPRDKFIEKEGLEISPSPLLNVSKFECKTDNQKIALKYLRERQVVFLTGSAGTGKSMLAVFQACTLLKQKKINKILLLRPAVAVGKTVGLLKGTLDDKLLPYFAQTIEHFKTFIGASRTTYSLDKKVIELGAVEYTRGRSFEDMMVIVEESQNLSNEEFEMILTRLGNNAQIVFTGDQRQHDLKGKSGLESTVALLDKMLDTCPEYLSDEDLDELHENIGVVQFTVDDVLRSGLTKAFVKMYFHS